MGIAKIVSITMAALALLPVRTEDVHAKWRDHIAAKPEECTFESIGWRGTFYSAVAEASQKRKPILLWAMNGHPLACT